MTIDMIKVSHSTAVDIAMAAYLGEKCKYCGKEYKALADLEDVVWAGHGRLACEKCYEDMAEE